MPGEKILIMSNSPALAESIRHNPLVEALEADIVLVEPGVSNPNALGPTRLKERGAPNGTDEGQDRQGELRPSGGPLWASPLNIPERPDPSAATPHTPTAVAAAAADVDAPSSNAGRPTETAAVDLMLPPSLDAARLMRFSHRFEKTAKAKIEGSAGSWKEGAILKAILPKSVSPLEVLRRMPEVAQAWEESPPRSGIRGLFKGRGKTLCFTEGEKRIRLLLKDPMEPVQLAFSL